MSRPGSLAWLARHELRLAWRDWRALVGGGRPGRLAAILVALALFAGFMHLLGYGLVSAYAARLAAPDSTTLLALSAALLFGLAMMLSQAMEAVTRVFYARDDLDLLLSAPVSPRRVFAIRMAAIGVTTTGLAALMASPFINVLAFTLGPQWLAAYAAVASIGAMATGGALALTMLLFRLLGPKRTRLVAQIAAAIIGGAFIIGVQAAAIISYGSVAPDRLLAAGGMAAMAVPATSPVWLPARALAGNPAGLAALALAGAGGFLLAVAAYAPRFATIVLATAGMATARRRAGRTRRFRPATAAQALRRKEWTLLLRDPWLLSQSLMQVLYLIPPAILLWRIYGTGADLPVIIAPVLVMAAGQLAGGLAWLAASGEDAPDLVATAPVTPARLIRAKIEAVLGGVGVVFLPLVAAVALVSPYTAAVTIAGVILASATSIAIQLWFRTQALRRHFRTRQTSSRIATMAEALAAISWAAAASLAAAGSWLTVFAAASALLVLGVARLLSPRPPEARRRRRPVAPATLASRRT